MPREHTSALCKVYSNNLSKITKALKNESLQIGRLDGVDITKENDGEYTIKLNFAKTPGNLEERQFLVTREQIQLLIAGKC